MLESRVQKIAPVAPPQLLSASAADVNPIARAARPGSRLEQDPAAGMRDVPSAWCGPSASAAEAPERSFPASRRARARFAAKEIPRMILRPARGPRLV